MPMRGGTVLNLFLSYDSTKEVGEHVWPSDHNIVSATLLLRYEFCDDGVRLLDFRKTNFERMKSDLGALGPCHTLTC